MRLTGNPNWENERWLKGDQHELGRNTYVEQEGAWAELDGGEWSNPSRDVDDCNSRFSESEKKVRVRAYLGWVLSFGSVLRPTHKGQTFNLGQKGIKQF